MTTAEAIELENDFRTRAAEAARTGDGRGEHLWSVAADLVHAAEANSIIDAFNRSRNRRAPKPLAESAKVPL